jgi:hypothetical protein
MDLTVINTIIAILGGSIGALGGGLAIVKSAYPYFSKPKLEAVPCSNTSGKDVYLQIKVTNSGQRPATNCVGRLLEIRNEKGEELEGFSQTELYWEYQNQNQEAKFKPITIYPNGFEKNLDVAGYFLTDKGNGDRRIGLRTFTGEQPTSYGSYQVGRIYPNQGNQTYYARIALYADENVVTEPVWYELLFSDDKFQITEVSEAFVNQLDANQKT